METVRNCFSFPYHPEDLSYFQALFIFSNHPGNLFCCQAFSDQGTANSGCNGDATLKSVFNFWKNQDLNKMKLERGLAELTAEIDQAVAGDDTEDSCARVKGLRDMIVAGLREKVKALQP